jgi:thiamine-phosphate pyrophosphorylase
LCYVTGRRDFPDTAPENSRSALIQKIGAILSGGVDWVQIREKDLSAKDLAAVTRQALSLAAAPRAGRPDAARILVNDRLDIALTERSGGVHLGERSLPVKEAKRLVALRGAGKDFLVGASCHSLDSVKSAEADGVDYVFFGPVFATPSKAAFGAPQGVDRFAEVCSSVSIPVLAIGGITLENAARCFAAGAAGIAAIRLFQDSFSAAATIGALRRMPR